MGSSNPQTNHSKPVSPTAEAWWQTYLQHFARQGIAAKQLVWYRRRVEQMLQHFPGRKSVDLAGSDITEYLTGFDGLGLPAWQVSQALVENGSDIRTVQELLGHKDVQTTMIYTHALNRLGLAVRSPADRL